MTIKRYKIDGDDCDPYSMPSPDGFWVKYCDHARAVDELKDARRRTTSALQDIARRIGPAALPLDIRREIELLLKEGLE